MKPFRPVVGLVAGALAACGHGGGSGGNTNALAVPFQAKSTTVTYAAPGAVVPNPVAGGPSSASASFIAGAGIGGSGSMPGDTAGNTVTITTDAAGNLATIAINITTPGGTGPALSQSFTGTVQGNMLSAAQFATLVAAIAAAPATTANAVYQGVVAGLNFSAYGAWMQSSGAGSYNVGTYSFGPETAAMPVTGTATYHGTTLGFGANNGGPTNQPFTFTGTATVSASFATNTITNLQFSNFTTQDVNDANPGPALSTISGTGAIVGNKYALPLAGTATPGGALAGTVNGMFYGAAAIETGGTWRAATGGNTLTLIGGFGAR